MSDSSIIQVMVVDDQPVVRSGLAALFLAFDDLHLVAEATNGEDAIALCEYVCPDVILMDLIMPCMDGAAATRLIRQRYPDTQVLILTSFKEDELLQQALNAGATGYLLKNISAEELADAVRVTYRERLLWQTERSQALPQATLQPAAPIPANKLTKRELEVLNLLAKDIHHHEIAGALGISHATVKFHIRNILSKLHVPNRAAAVALALKHEILL